jgi:hypothetical protein
LALATPDHFQSQPALDDWEQQAAEQVNFCTVTALGLMHEGDLSARLCTNACLAALAICDGWRLVSFDRGFERFGDLQRLSLNRTSTVRACSQDPSELY